MCLSATQGFTVTPVISQFLGMLRSGIISDVMFLCNPSEGLFHSLVAMGRDVCGHRCTVHGGFTSAVIDETTGKAGGEGMHMSITAVRFIISCFPPLSLRRPSALQLQVPDLLGQNGFISG